VDLPASDRVSVLRRTQESSQPLPQFRLRDSHPLWCFFPVSFCYQVLVTFTAASYNPDWSCQPVWASPLSLATTQGIISFPEGTEMFQFPSFPPHSLCVQLRVTGVRPAGFPHSDILGYSVRTQLPEAFRSVPRPSSAFDAKASTVRPL
jgi:hypothetical protein